MDQPILSVVVAIVSDTTSRPNATSLERCLAGLRAQTIVNDIEILVPFHPSTLGIGPLAERYPEVRFLEAADLRAYAGRGGNREHHDELRACGLCAASGSIAALIEDHGIPASDWGERLVTAHREPFAGIGGAIENGIDRPLNWAVYFCDFLRYQNPLPAGESALVSDANVAYKRTALESVRPVWQEIFRESSVTQALRQRSEKLALAPEAIVYQHRADLRLGSALRERFVWGRSYAVSRSKPAGAARRIFWAVFAPVLPLLLLTRMTATAWKKRRTWSVFLKALPLTAALVVSWSCGELVGYLTGRVNNTQD